MTSQACHWSVSYTRQIAVHVVCVRIRVTATEMSPAHIRLADAGEVAGEVAVTEAAGSRAGDSARRRERGREQVLGGQAP